MPLKYGDALRDVTLSQIMGVIRTEENFAYKKAAIKVIESENNKKFDVYFSKDLSDKKTKEWAFIESLIAEDKEQARRHRRMKRHPENNFGVIVNFKKGDDEERTVRVHYFYDDKNKKIAELSIQMKIVEDFLEFKGFETSEEVTAYVRKIEKEYDALWRLRQSGMLPGGRYG